MRVLITGGDGFIGRNLAAHLAERADIKVVKFTHSDDPASLPTLVKDVDFIFHLAGVNRPKDQKEFNSGNAELTAGLCAAVASSGRKIGVIYTSSIQATLDNPYGHSKLAAEEALLQLNETHGSSVYLYRLPNVFGKWARPDYNSAVATFCHNIARDLPIRVNDPSASLSLVYIDDVVAEFVGVLDGRASDGPYCAMQPQYETTVGDVADQIRAFRESRRTLVTERVGGGLTRALYATYVSYLPPNEFVYGIPKYGDARGVFVEMLKTADSGQFSFFTAYPGVTRGGHYHHSKTEKFLVIKGRASFRFRHILTGEFHERLTDGEKPEIVETVPGWTHDITNVGDDEMVVMLWANEIFDRERPDTYARALDGQA